MAEPDTIIQRCHDALTATSVGDPTRLHLLHTLSDECRNRYKDTKAIEDLERSIQVLQEALRVMPDGHAERACRLDDLGDLFCSRFKRTKKQADLDIAIHQWQQSLQRTPSKDPKRASRLESLGLIYRERAMQGTNADREIALQCFQQALAITPRDHPRYESGPRSDWLQYIEDLSSSWWDSPPDSPGDVKAIQNFQEAIQPKLEGESGQSQGPKRLVLRGPTRAALHGSESAEPPPESPYEAYDRVPKWLHPLLNLGNRYQERYKEIIEAENIENAIQQNQKALDSIAYDHPRRTRHVWDLGIQYHSRYRRTGKVADLDKSIQLFLEAVETTPQKHPYRASRFQRLGDAYHARFQRLGGTKDLDKAIRQYRKALVLTPEEDLEGLESRLHNLGAGYHSRYQITGEATDLDRAIGKYRQALSMKTNDVLNQTRQLLSLVTGYRDRYQRTGAMEDLEKAVSTSEKLKYKAVESNLGPEDGAFRFQSTGSVHLEKHWRTGAMSELEAAITDFHQALKATSGNRPAHRFGDLGAAYHARYLRTKQTADLDRAIELYQYALDKTPDDHPNWSKRLHSLGTSYQDRYLYTGAVSDLNKAIQYVLKALETTPQSYLDRISQLESLGIAFHIQYQKTGAAEDLEMAIEKLIEALAGTPDRQPKRASRLHSLGSTYREKYQKTGTMKDLEMAISSFQHAVDHSWSPITDRLKSCQALIPLYVQAEKWSLAYDAASTAISLVPLLAPRSLSTFDKQLLVAELAGFACDAAALAIMAGKTPYDALRDLECGRGVILGSLYEVTEEIREFQRKQKLPPDDLMLEMMVDQYRSERESIDQNTRKVPSEMDLKAAAVSGPIVVLNISRYCCDAFLVETTGLRVLRLPRLHVSEIQAWAQGSPVNPECLEWLWESLAKPVLDALRFTRAPMDGIWPRIWWVPTGALVGFPIHASGFHITGSSDTVLDRVISCYGSSISTLVYLGHTFSNLERKPHSWSALLVGMPETREQKDLASVPKEIEELDDLLDSMGINVHVSRSYLQDVRSRLQSHEIFHFAGHGLIHSSDARKSGLLLWDGVLMVEELLEEYNKQRRFLAYLSACGTGQVKHDGLIDESLHLISACQLSGFRHVIGTLWEVDDKSCLDAALLTYKWIGMEGMTDASVSEGLHHAIRTLRDHWVEENTAIGTPKDRMRAQEKPAGQIVGEQLRPGIPIARHTRDVDLLEDDGLTPLHWAPFVYFGV